MRRTGICYCNVPNCFGQLHCGKQNPVIRVQPSLRFVQQLSRFSCFFDCLPKVARNGKPDVTAGRRDGRVLAESPPAMQGTNMSARMTFLAAAMLVAGCGAASAACGSAISEFERIITNDAKTGNLNKGVHKRIADELFRAQQACIAGREAEASNTLAAIKKRHGYR